MMRKNKSWLGDNKIEAKMKKKNEKNSGDGQMMRKEKEVKDR